MGVICGVGMTAEQEQICPDLSAVGIQSITQSQDGTKMYVTLTNGATLTFTLPAGAQGAKGNTGNTGAAGAAGAAGANGSAVVGDVLTDSPTTLLSTYETLGSFATDPTNSAKNFVKQGDNIAGIARFEEDQTDLNNQTDTNSTTDLRITYTDLSNVVHTDGLFYVNVAFTGGYAVFEYKFSINASSANSLRINTEMNQYGVTGGTGFPAKGGWLARVLDYANVDFTKPITISAGANSQTSIGDTVLRIFTGTMNKF